MKWILFILAGGIILQANLPLNFKLNTVGLNKNYVAYEQTTPKELYLSGEKIW